MGSIDAMENRFSAHPVSRDKLWVGCDFRKNLPIPRPYRIREGQVGSVSAYAKYPNRGSRLCQMDQTLVNCFFDRGGAAGSIEFLKQTFDVGLHRPFGYPKFVSDGFVTVAFGNQT